MVIAVDFATPLYGSAVRLRHEVLRVPLGRDIANDPLHLEHDQKHLVALDTKGIVVGTAALQTSGSGLKMRQVAVAEHVRGSGVGRALVRACERHARQVGADRLYCHARSTALNFYERCGWRVEGPVFTEVDIPHRLCVAQLERPPT